MTDLYTSADVRRLVGDRCDCSNGLVEVELWDGTTTAQPCDLCVKGGLVNTRDTYAELSRRCPECDGDGLQVCGFDARCDCAWCCGYGAVTATTYHLWTSWKESVHA